MALLGAMSSKGVKRQKKFTTPRGERGSSSVLALDSFDDDVSIALYLKLDVLLKR